MSHKEQDGCLILMVVLLLLMMGFLGMDDAEKKERKRIYFF